MKGVLRKRAFNWLHGMYIHQDTILKDTMSTGLSSIILHVLICPTSLRTLTQCLLISNAWYIHYALRYTNNT